MKNVVAEVNGHRVGRGRSLLTVLGPLALTKLGVHDRPAPGVAVASGAQRPAPRAGFPCLRAPRLPVAGKLAAGWR